MKTEREKIIEEIAAAIKKNHEANEGTSSYTNYAVQVYEDVILADRKRVVEPLVKELKLLKSYFEDRREVVLHVNDIDWKAIDQTLKNAGLKYEE